MENVSSLASYASVTSVGTQEKNQLPSLECRGAKEDLKYDEKETVKSSVTYRYLIHLVFYLFWIKRPIVIT